MAAPIADFLYSPLGGKSPLEITFINQSKNLGATNEWAACTLGKKYFHSALTSSTDDFVLDLSDIPPAVSFTYNENGFRIESNGIHYPGDLYDIISIDDLTINCDDDFYIEITINSFNSYYGSIELYFPEITASIPPYNIVNPGIHINTSGGIGIVKGINNAGDIANLSDYTFPIKLKFKKVD